MNNNSINFDNWSKNHLEDHNAKWYRELYPWEVFQRLKFDESSIGIEQQINVGESRFIVKIESRYVGKNERVNYIIHLTSIIRNRADQWNQRAWNDQFHLVEDPNGTFITLYTEKKDPSKVVVKQFLKSQLRKIEEIRNLPVSGLLFRSIISYAAHDSLKGIQRYRSFPVIPSYHILKSTELPLLGEMYEPFLSQDRDLWIAYSFTEEKAHRLALRLSSQADKLYVVYCHPTFSQHQRTKIKSTKVVSLIEYLRFVSPVAYKRYLQPTCFLINHLKLPTDLLVQKEVLATDEVLKIIQSQQEPIIIKTSELREAKNGIGLVVRTAGETAYVCACGNLLNAALNSRSKFYNGSVSLSKKVYSFKRILGRAIEEIILIRPPGVEIYVSNKNLILVRVRGLQFSFHALPKTKIIATYESSDSNRQQDWSGLRLQPFAPLILKWARCLLSAESNYYAKI